MQKFLEIQAIWLFLSFVLAFFFTGLLSQRPYLVAVFAAIVFSVITYAFVVQSDQIDALKKRVEELEKAEGKDA